MNENQRINAVSCFYPLPDCPFVGCHPVEVGDESDNQCNSSILVNVESGLPTDQVYVDGVKVVKKPGESFSISTGSRILSVKVYHAVYFVHIKMYLNETTRCRQSHEKKYKAVPLCRFRYGGHVMIIECLHRSTCVGIV